MQTILADTFLSYVVPMTSIFGFNIFIAIKVWQFQSRSNDQDNLDFKKQKLLAKLVHYSLY